MTGEMAIRSSQEVTEPVNTALCDGAEDAHLGGASYWSQDWNSAPLNGTGLKAMDMKSEGLAKSPSLNAV